jgi:hypothetical protein
MSKSWVQAATRCNSNTLPQTGQAQSHLGRFEGVCCCCLMLLLLSDTHMCHIQWRLEVKWPLKPDVCVRRDGAREVIRLHMWAEWEHGLGAPEGL